MSQTLTTVKKVRRKQPILEAVYYSGTSDARKSVVEWSEGFIIEYNKKLYLRFPRTILLTREETTCWILKEGPYFCRLSEEDFHSLYTFVNESKRAILS